jgi:hypothetical protein
MRKLTRDEILALQDDGSASYYVKIYKIYDYNPVLAWEGETALGIARYLGALDAIFPEEPGSVWVIGSEDDVENDGDIVVEDYMMEVFVYTD